MKSSTLHRFAVLTAACTFGLLLVGGIVHGTGSSLACPDWPLCYGEVFPKMVGGVFYEHSHRILAFVIGCMTIAICVMALRRRRDDRRLAVVGPLALVMVIVQGVLGGLTVIFKLPTAVSTAHLGLSMIFFATVIYAAWITRADASTSTVSASLRRLIAVTTGAVYLQVVLGGLVRHTGGGMACADSFPLCNDKLWTGLHATAQVQMAHRFVAVAVSLLVVITAVRVYRASTGFTRVLAVAAPVLLAVQILLGILSVWSLLGLWQVTAHLGGGALLLANCWLLWLSTRAATAPQPHTAGATSAMVRA